MGRSPVNMPNLPDHQALETQARALDLGVEPSELHGSLCGFLAGGGDADRRRWLSQLALEAGSVEQGSPLDALFEASTWQLADSDYSFRLLLPADSAALEVRAQALIGWCRGFLGGFGLGGRDATALSPEGAEALQDLATLAASEPGFESPETDEEALGELGEFVRVAALLLYGDCVLGAQSRRRLH
jgi:uncharacterized protein YgfB (UPF0149 family)